MAEMNASRFETIKTFLMEYRNFPGAMALIKAWGLSKEEVHQILQEVLRDAEQKGLLQKKQFDIETMRYLSLEAWIREKMEREREFKKD